MEQEIKPRYEPPENYAGTVLGELTVVKFAGRSDRGELCYIVQCTCGKQERVLKGHLQKAKRACLGCTKRRHNKKFFRVIHHLQNSLNNGRTVA